MSIASTDYHDYVFKDGALVGDFEAMYRNSAVVPWRQDRTAYEVGADIDIAIMRTERYRDICDAGCGLGYFTNCMKRELQDPEGEEPTITGVDTSPTAIERASARFPGIRFIASDLVNGPRDDTASRCDLVVAKDVLWYVYKQLNRFLLGLVAMVRSGDGGGHIHITQSFPSGERWVGREVISSPESLLHHLAQIMTVTYRCVEQDIRWSGASVLHVFGAVK